MERKRHELILLLARGAIVSGIDTVNISVNFIGSMVCSREDTIPSSLLYCYQGLGFLFLLLMHSEVIVLKSYLRLELKKDTNYK